MTNAAQQPPTSPSLIHRAQQAETTAWEQLTRLYSPLVFDWARSAGLQPDDAADVMQDVFRTLAARLRTFQRRDAADSFRGWLYTITRNQIRDYFRSRRRREHALGGTDAQQMWSQMPAEPPPADSEAGQSELSALRHRALELLSGQFRPRTWQAFWRTTIQNDSPQDVAADLGISVWAVYKARARVLTRLRNEFADLL